MECPDVRRGTSGCKEKNIRMKGEECPDERREISGCKERNIRMKGEKYPDERRENPDVRTGTSGCEGRRGIFRGGGEMNVDRMWGLNRIFS